MLAKGNNARSGSRAMVETIAVTDGELTALSALSGQQLLTIDGDCLNQSDISPGLEEAVCVTIPNDETMEVDGEELVTSSDIIESTITHDDKDEAESPSQVVVSSGNIISRTPVLMSVAGQSSASTSYVVIQSSPGNRVITTNTAAAGKKGAQIPQIIGRVNSAGPSPQMVVRAISSSGPPPLVSRGANLNVAGIRPLNPQAANQRGQIITKVLLPRSGSGQQLVTLPFQDGKSGEQQRFMIGGQQVRVLSGGMKIATIPSSTSETKQPKIEVEKKTVIQTSGIATSSPPGRPFKVIQSRPVAALNQNKVQHLIPSSPGSKGLIVNKVLPGTGTRVTVVPQGAKSPAKILPAPLSIATSSASQPGGPSISPQKVIIRHASIKPITGQAAPGLRIPVSSQPTLVNSSALQPVQVAGRQMQYVRLVSIPSSSSDSTATVTNTAVAKGSTVLTLSSASGSQHGSTIKMIPVGTSTPKTVVAKTMSGQKIIIPASLAMTQIKTSVPSSVMSVVSSTPTSTTSSNIVMLPSTSIQTAKAISQPDMDIKPIIMSLAASAEESSVDDVEPVAPPAKPEQAPAPPPAKQSKTSLPEPNGIKPRKPCNCTKSQCLKLYCDCFANGEFCNQCNCNCCYNNLDHEEDRQRAIRSCLERNPNAFRPKIGKGIVGDGRRHTKGCNCKRSGCLKNYCECYEAKIACSNNCKCVGCRNIEDDIDRRSLRELIEVENLESPLLLPSGLKKKSQAQILEVSSIKQEDGHRRGDRRSDCIMSDHVVSATCQCLVAQAEEAEKLNLNEEEAERLIIEEFGRCLVEIISCVTNRTDLDRQDTSSTFSEHGESS
ncbi:Protein lin-54-like protein [Frankliniella fusca]|uniref:Protein lin-54-like protein n=1 Tax=Frankliniella fusca TaxID=407009 RepID=A0AAE1LM79_9NEOP|nr:Protein lin-54-like protein [Frankliniella fusca]